MDKQKLNSISSTDSDWEKDAIYRQKNQDWLEKSAKVALLVLRTLKNKSLSQKDLAKLMDVKPQQVNKIVKGRENLTFETICKLEKALEIPIIDINEFIVKKYSYKTEFTLSELSYKNKDSIPYKYPPFLYTYHDASLQSGSC